MGAHFIVLILSLLIAGTAAAAVPGKGSQCFSCHKPHYTDKGPCTSCHRGDDRTTRLTIAHHNFIPGRYAFFAFSTSQQVKTGQRLIDTFACRRCHTVRGRGNNFAANLDRLFWTTAPHMIEAAITSPAIYMPDFRSNERQRVALVNALEAGGRKAEAQPVETAQIVHFAGSSAHGQNRFEKKCGGCHKVLSKSLGGLGVGDIGPNLSGLFSEFYPATFPKNQRWTEENLRKWLQNPREVRTNSLMRPVLLEKEELKEVIRMLR